MKSSSQTALFILRASQNQAVTADDSHQSERNTRRHSNSVTEIGTATLSSREVLKGLEDALTRQTNSSRRNATIR